MQNSNFIDWCVKNAFALVAVAVVVGVCWFMTSNAVEARKEANSASARLQAYEAERAAERAYQRAFEDGQQSVNVSRSWLPWGSPTVTKASYR